MVYYNVLTLTSLKPFYQYIFQENHTMEIYLRDKAEKKFNGLNIPDNSMGVFKANDEEWIYWFKDGKIYDTGSATTEAEAMHKAKRYIPLRDPLHKNTRKDIDSQLEKFFSL